MRLVEGMLRGELLDLSDQTIGLLLDYMKKVPSQFTGHKPASDLRAKSGAGPGAISLIMFSRYGDEYTIVGLFFENLDHPTYLEWMKSDPEYALAEWLLLNPVAADALVEKLQLTH